MTASRHSASSASPPTASSPIPPTASSPYTPSPTTSSTPTSSPTRGTPPASGPPHTRPGGRSARVRAAVHRAVEELLAADPSEPLTIPVIAARAGVHPTTVYRRWSSLGELLAAVAASRFSGDVVVPDTGTLRGDLERWVADVATDLTDPDVLALMRAAVGAAGPEGGHACVADRRTQLAAMLERERARGGGQPELERAVDALLGPLYFRALFTDHPAQPDWARELVGALLVVSARAR